MRYALVLIVFFLFASVSIAQATFESWDKDKDGFVSQDEFPAQLPKQLFNRADTNNDGKLSKDEDEVFREQRLNRTRQQRKSLPEGTTVERDLKYGSVGGRDLLLDLYRPKTNTKTLPVIVWIHGGGWKGGRKGNAGQARFMISHGYAVVDVGYRLSGEAIFPAAIEDCKTAIRWIRANAKKYGIDPDRIGVSGSSAGGHLAALVGTTGDTEEFKTTDHAQFSSKVQAVIDLYGPTDFLQMEKHDHPEGPIDHDAEDSPESLFVGGPIQEEPFRSIAAKANPITYASKSDPPFLVVHGNQDRLVAAHQSTLLYEALKKEGVDITLKVLKGAGHGGPQFESPDFYNVYTEFFDKHLK